MLLFFLNLFPLLTNFVVLFYSKIALKNCLYSAYTPSLRSVSTWLQSGFPHHWMNTALIKATGSSHTVRSNGLPQSSSHVSITSSIGWRWWASFLRLFFFFFWLLIKMILTLFFYFFLLLFNYRCMPFLPTPPPHPRWTHLPPPPPPSPLVLSMCPL